MGQPPLQVRDARLRDAKALGDVFVEAWRREHAGLLPQEVLHARSAAESAANWSRTLTAIARGQRENQFVLAAVRGTARVGLVVGMVQAEERPDGEGEVTVIQVADRQRGHGVGAALMSAAVRRLIGTGARSMIVRVLEANGPARRFYERQGGQLTTETRTVEESGLWFPERLYQWTDLAAFPPA
jgi:ribosomal protein S18 acetylase RimI-like enzyme